MAAQEDGVSRAHDGVSIALLRRLRAGEEIPYVHRADVCSAAPADLVADLMPAPGTDQTNDGYNSIWYFYCPKRYKNTKGEKSGHRQRRIGADGETRWHPEVRTKDVPGSDGGTFRTCSYGRMKDGSLERLGWCMIEYDLVDKQVAAGTAASSYVLCKVHRPSSRTKGKASSSSSSKSAATSSCSKRKRKAAGSGNPEAPPAKLTHIQQEQVQMQHDNTFGDGYPMPCYEQPHAWEPEIYGTFTDGYPMPCYEQAHVWAPENYGGFVQTEYGPMPSQLAHINVGDWIGYPEMLGAEAEQGLQHPEQGGELIQIACGQTMPGECVCVGPQHASRVPDDDFFVALAQEVCMRGSEQAAAKHRGGAWRRVLQQDAADLFKKLPCGFRI